jgi:hypothetical protein
MKSMSNIPYILDLKLSVFGVALFVFSSFDLELSLKIISSIIFIGYTIRRWYLLEKKSHKTED